MKHLNYFYVGLIGLFSMLWLGGGQVAAQTRPEEPKTPLPQGLTPEDWQAIQALAPGSYFKASNTDAGDFFGSAIAVSGDTVVVGARLEDSNEIGVNGDQTDNSATDAGAVYVFTRTNGVWSQQAYLKASNTDAYDYFGEPVAISGDTIVVGAWGEDSHATGVNGSQGDNSSYQSGAVYVFTRASGVWSQEAYLKASNTDAYDYFGFSVAIDGETIVVGAPNEDSNATGVNGNQGDNSATNAGAAYVFTRTAGVWSQEAYLKASNTNANDYFGESVAISGDTIVVGAAWEDSNATGVNGNQGDNSADEAGAAYVFLKTRFWNQQAYLKASNTNTYDYFGESVAISGDTIVVGAAWEDSNATGVNGNQGDNTANAAGAAYVFTRTAGVWSQEAYLKASNTNADDCFGFSVAISGDTIVVGAWGESSNSTGVNGNQGNNSAGSAGAAYLFTRTGGVWSQEAYLKASNTNIGDGFGFSVAIAGETIVVGASWEDSHATGVNGNQGDNSAGSAGAVYSFGLGGELGVTVNGSGQGTVVSDPAGINCGADCSENYIWGTVITLTATAEVGSTFTSWSGACTGAGACVVTLNQSSQVMATFALNSYPLNVEKLGNGSGLVVSNPAGINCGTDCSESYLFGTLVTLIAVPASDSIFVGWSGACRNTEPSCEVTIDTSNEVGAIFALITHELNVTKQGNGAGLVVSDPAGIHCGSDCTESYPTGTVITLTATADIGSIFTGWDGDCSGLEECVFTIGANTQAVANFEIANYQLVVDKQGNGAGLVESDPAGINCGVDCTENYPAGTEVTLTAAPHNGSTFTGWDGDCTGLGNCVLLMDAYTEVIANFELNQYELSVDTSGTGFGSVVSDPAGINCGADCVENYDFGTVVTLTATAEAGSTFVGWDGDCTGLESCVIVMGSNREANANFELNSYELTVAHQGNGSGVVVSDPLGINCGSDCAESYLFGTVVTLTAVSATGSSFTGWDGDCEGLGSCVVTIGSNSEAIANFELNSYELTVARQGNGSGVVVSDPLGINCGSDCSESYLFGTVITLTATADSSSIFTGWSGACAGTAACVVTVEQAQTVTATFELVVVPADYTIFLPVLLR